MATELTEDNITEINETLAVLQKDVQSIINNISNENYEQAIEAVQNAMEHTECPICQDKFTIIGADIVKTKMLCKLGDAKCKSQRTESIKFAKSVKDTFLPIATEKNIANQHSVSNGNELIYTKENGYKYNHDTNDTKITPFNAPLLLLDNFVHELSK